MGGLCRSGFFKYRCRRPDAVALFLGLLGLWHIRRRLRRREEIEFGVSFVFRDEVTTLKQFFHGTAVGTVRDMKCVLNCCTAEFQFEVILIAAALEIQTKTAACEVGVCFLPIVNVHLYEILAVGGLMDCNCSLVCK